MLLESPNFAFLKSHDPQLVKLATAAEKYFKQDPVTCLMKLRQFGELLAQIVAANFGVYTTHEEPQLKLLNRLNSQNLLTGEVNNIFHELRRVGNDATHQNQGDHRTALNSLKLARQLGIWLHRTFSNDANFKPGAFIPPPDPTVETVAMKEELEKLRLEAVANRTAAEMAEAKRLEELELREVAEELLEETEAEFKRIKENLERLQAAGKQHSSQETEVIINKAQIAEAKIELSESETRALVDKQLIAAGWEADSESLTYSQGVRPQKNKNLAIAEWPIKRGAADYALFVGLQLVAFVEAKRRIKDVPGAIDQAKRYSKHYLVKGDEVLTGGPWGEFKVPFVFSTNGRPFLEQLRTQSGVWFCDLTRRQNLRRPLVSWYSPQGLLALLERNLERSHSELQEEGFNYNIDVRDYQQRAILAAEKALASDCRNLLIAMATGTGKTKTSIVLVYRLLKTKRFRRVLFLVDRSALGEQAANAYKETRIESLQTFADIFEVKELGANDVDVETKVNIATVQSFVRRVLYASDDVEAPTVDEYDCIIVDECHRGYLLDRELSDTELTFRDSAEYISKYRRVLDYFDAVKIGLTATPALHTTQIFGEPVFTYSYREAVLDGWLIDHEPPVQIRTELAEEGMKWEQGDNLEFFDPATGEIDLVRAPDEINIDIDGFNKKVITESFNRVVCEALAKYIDPSLPEKTLIFCATDRHADIVVDQLKLALQREYGSVDDDDVQKITGNTDKPLLAIRKFRNEASPKIAVTVDLLTTGIDVLPICNLVFIRRVKSRILYEQMLGRATRPCDGIDKQVFRIFDAVRLYEGIAPVTSMKPVAVNPNISFAQLVDELAMVKDEKVLPEIVEQFLAKFQRQRRNLTDERRGEIERVAGMSLTELGRYLKESEPTAVVEWFKDKRAIAQILDIKDGGSGCVLVSRHEDKLVAVESGYGEGQKPEGYLESFRAFVRDNLNQIPALMLVAQRPRELTRAQLKELRMALELAGFSEAFLQTAWRETTNEEIAASIIGFVRQAALGDALIPYSQRVDGAIARILASQNWTSPQRKWLERIGKQLKLETVMDREAFDKGQFKVQGGFNRINKTFEGRLESVLMDINREIWEGMG